VRWEDRSRSRRPAGLARSGGRDRRGAEVSSKSSEAVTCGTILRSERAPQATAVVPSWFEGRAGGFLRVLIGASFHIHPMANQTAG
jgi:hypothetical protein